MSRERKSLRQLRAKHRQDIRELEAEGVSKRELKDAVQRCHADGQLPTGDSAEDLAEVIAAELFDTAQLPTGVNWDKILELIEKLMPLIEAWMAGCL